MKRKLILILTAVMAFSMTAADVFAASDISINKVRTVKDQTEINDVYMKIVPRDAVSTGDTIVLTFSNAEILTPLPEFGDEQGNGISWDDLDYELYTKGARDTLIRLWDSVSDNYIPWKYKKLNSKELEVELFPIPNEFCDNQGIGKGTKPYYFLPLHVMSDTDGKAVDINVSVNPNGTSIGGSKSSYDIGDVPVGNTDNSSDTTTKAEESTETTTETKTEGNTKPDDNNTEPYEIRVTIGSTSATSAGKTYTLDVAPYIQPSSSSTMVPLRFVTVAAGGGDAENADSSSLINWNPSTKTAIITLDGNTISFTAGSPEVTVNGKAKTMENGVVAEIKDGRMFIPFRALGSAIGVGVDWEPSTKTAIFKIS